MLFAVGFHSLLQFHPLHTLGGVQILEVIHIILDGLHLVDTCLGVGKRLTEIGVDKRADIHVAHLGGAHCQTQFCKLLVGQRLRHKVLPHLLANLIIHVGRHLADTLLAFIIVFHLFHQFVKVLVADGSAVDLAHIGYTTVVLGKVTDNKCYDSHTNHGHGYPRVFSNTSYDSHL